jgi:hypothetical protein
MTRRSQSSTPNASAPSRPPTPGPAQRRLEVFVGVWKTTGNILASEAEPATSIVGTDTYEWLPGGFFLLHRVDVRMGDQEVKATEIIGHDAAAQTYRTHAFDNQGGYATYEASYRDGIWVFTGETERVTLVASDGGNTLTGNWMKKSDDATWRPWMDITLTRSTAEDAPSSDGA